MGEQVQELLERSESKALEFKTDLHDQGQAAALIAAMANSGGGQIVLGANERAGIKGHSLPPAVRSNEGTSRGAMLFSRDRSSSARLGRQAVVRVT